MKHYLGCRTIDGIIVTVNGVPLDPRYDLERFTELGFEWSYKGDSPQQLALALIADCVGSDQARRWSEPFMVKVVAHLDNDWRLTDADIRTAMVCVNPEFTND
jgi:hypothetical protein